MQATALSFENVCEYGGDGGDSESYDYCKYYISVATMNSLHEGPLFFLLHPDSTGEQYFARPF